jgi:hypothetical protein
MKITEQRLLTLGYEKVEDSPERKVYVFNEEKLSFYKKIDSQNLEGFSELSIVHLRGSFIMDGECVLTSFEEVRDFVYTTIYQANS